MNRLNYILFVLASVALIPCSLSQSLDRKLNKGIFIRLGASKAQSSSDVFSSGGIGLFGLIRMNNDDSSPIRYLKVELGLSNRKGVFNIPSVGNIGFNVNSYDLALICPYNISLTDNLGSNIGIGTNLSYQVDRKQFQDGPSIQPFSYGNRFHFGVVGDFGFLFTGNSTALFGLRTLYEFADYPYAEIGLYFGYDVGKLINKKRK